MRIIMSSCVGLQSRFGCFLFVKSERNKEKLINLRVDVNVAKSETDQVTATERERRGGTEGERRFGALMPALCVF